MQLDAKKSPLALLAQTCSQIGADSPSKPLLSSLEKSSSKSSTSSVNNARSPPAAKHDRTRSSPSDGKTSSSSHTNLAFKPYETNVVSIKRSSGDEGGSSSRPNSKASVHSVSGHDSANNCISASDETNNNSHYHSKKSASRSTPQSRKSASPAQPTAASNRSSPSSNSNSSSINAERKSPADVNRDEKSPRNNNNSGTSPIIRSGMEILSGHANPKDPTSLYKSTLGAFGANPLCCPPGLDPAAFRSPYPGAASAFSHHHAALLGYPGATTTTTPTSNPYLSYARVKTSTGAETLVPVCKDPYCTGCQYSMHNTQMMMVAAAGAQSAGATCPSGCTQCDHQKYSSLMSLTGLGSMAPPPPSLASYHAAVAAATAASSGGRPHVCSWMAGDSFCGKRFATGEELLQHLRSHTNAGAVPHSTSQAVPPTSGSADPATTAALLANGGQHPLLTSTAALHRAAAAVAASASSYPAPSLSPLSARYHPYGKPPTGPPLPASLAASPYSAFNPLGPYYSPYALYGQRIGAAVHP